MEQTLFSEGMEGGKRRGCGLGSSDMPMTGREGGLHA